MSANSPVESTRSWQFASILLGLPLVGWVLRLSLTGWVPQGDWAVGAVKTHDVFSGHLQLLGMPSTSGNEVAGAALHHFGPLAFQLGWLPYRISGFAPWGILLGSGLLVWLLMVVGLRAAQSVAGRNAVMVLTAVYLVM